MRRIAIGGFVHFAANESSAVCGAAVARDLFGDAGGSAERVSDPVTCPDCARIYCLIKNAPWNEVDADALGKAVYAAARA